MSALRELQHAFLDAVLGGEPARAAALVHDRGIPAAERLEVYANNAYVNALQALEAGFPTVLALGGGDWFRTLARDYLRACPSRSGDLHWLGERWPEFLAGAQADTPYAYFAEVARLEWAYQQVVVAADAAPFAPVALAEVPAERYGELVFLPHPAARWVRARIPLLDLWRAHRPGGDPGGVRLDAGAQCVLVIRRADHIELAELPADECALLDAFAAGEPLARVELPETARGLDALLPALFARGVLAGFRYAD